MNCNNCKMIEMLVMTRNKKEVVYQCPKCLEISKISIEKEEEIIKEQNETIIE